MMIKPGFAGYLLQVSFQTQDFLTQKSGNQKGEGVNIVGTLTTFFPAKKPGSVPCNDQAVGSESVSGEEKSPCSAG